MPLRYATTLRHYATSLRYVTNPTRAWGLSSPEAVGLSSYRPFRPRGDVVFPSLPEGSLGWDVLVVSSSALLPSLFCILWVFSSIYHKRLSRAATSRNL